MRAGPGVSILVGARGCGKTSLRRIAQDQAPSSIRAIAARAETAGFETIFTILLDALGAEAAVSTAGGPQEALRERLAQLSQAEVGVVLFIDDAHLLAPAALAQAAELTDCGRLEDGRPFGLRLILVGDDLLRDKIDAADREPLHAAEVFELRPFICGEIASYVRARLGRSVSESTLRRLGARSGGVPAQLNLILKRIQADAGSAKEGVWYDAGAVDAAADALGLGEIGNPELCQDIDQGPFFSSGPLPGADEKSGARPTRPFAPAELDHAPPPESPAPAPHRTRRTGPRLVNRARWKSVATLSRLALGGAVVIGLGLGGAALLWRAVFPAAADQGVELASTTTEAYERNRGAVLDVMDGALAATEEAARRAAAAEAPFGSVAADLAADAAEARGVLRAGRAAEAFEQLPPKEAAAARRAELARLFAAAERHFDAQRYTRPAGANAYAELLSAYRLDPRSESAERGFARLIAVYRGLARAALEKSDFDSYYRYNELVDRIEARDPI